MSGTRTKTRRPDMAPRTVSRPHERTEREADKAADLVARGGSVTGWSFSSVAATAPVARQDDGKGTPDEEKKKPPEDENKNAPEAAQAALDTPAGEKVQQSILDLPEVKKAIAFAKTPTGIGLGVGLGAAGVTALAASHKPLPFQPPAIPLDKIGLPGVGAKVTLDGPVDRPTGVGLTLTYTEPGPKKKKGPTESEKVRAETERLRAGQERFRAGLKYVPGSAAAKQQEADDKATQEAVARFVASRSSLPGVGRPLIPVTGTTPGTTAPAPQEEKKKPDETPVQREPATTSDAGAHVDTSRVDDALRGGGRPLDPATRRAMEARFGYDFAHVRLHDDAAANAAASDVSASAFTVGSDIVVAGGALDTRTPAGRRLLAHELAHVVQQAGVRGPVLHRRSALETIGIWLGLIEGTFSDRELTTYLTAITSAGRIDGAYDADNKARAIVRKWKRGEAGWDLLPGQKALLIAEMLDGPTGDDDEQAILDLLELSDASDLRAMFGAGRFTLDQLESDLNWAEHDRLEAFLNSRFDGGRDAVAAGRIVVVGPPVPKGAPAFPFGAATVDGWVDSDRTSEEIIGIVENLAPATRTLVLHHLSQVRRPRMLTTLQKFERDVRESTDDTQRIAAQALVAGQRQFMLKVERVLLHFFLTAIPPTASDLTANTSPTDPARQAELRDALVPAASGGPGATFRNQIPGEPKTYEKKLAEMLPGIVTFMHKKIVEERPLRTHTLDEFAAIAKVSKDETDKVFGNFYDTSDATHPAFVADKVGTRGTLHDAFADTDRAQKRMTGPQRRVSALDMLMYLITTRGQIQELSRHHDARPKFNKRGQPTNDEAKLQDKVAREFVKNKDNVKNLLEIDRGWDASANPLSGEVFVQLFQPTDAAKDRLLLWDMFQTLIHEYLHTVVARPYRDYAESFGRHSPAENTLIEGMDSVLDEIVWEHVAPRAKSKELREKIEGPVVAATPPIDVPHASRRRYPSYTEALKLADLVGITNVYAAYFLGLVDRIGGPAPGATP